MEKSYEYLPGTRRMRDLEKRKRTETELSLQEKTRLRSEEMNRIFQAASPKINADLANLSFEARRAHARRAMGVLPGFF